MKRTNTAPLSESRQEIASYCGRVEGGAMCRVCVCVCVRPIAFPSVGPDKGEVGRRSALACKAVTVPAHRVSAHPSRCLAVSLRSSFTN